MSLTDTLNVFGINICAFSETLIDINHRSLWNWKKKVSNCLPCLSLKPPLCLYFWTYIFLTNIVDLRLGQRFRGYYPRRQEAARGHGQFSWDRQKGACQKMGIRDKGHESHSDERRCQPIGRTKWPGSPRNIGCCDQSCRNWRVRVYGQVDPAVFCMDRLGKLRHLVYVIREWYYVFKTEIEKIIKCAYWYFLSCRIRNSRIKLAPPRSIRTRSLFRPRI